MDEIRRANGMWPQNSSRVVENSAFEYEKDSEENSRGDDTLDAETIVADLEKIDTLQTIQDEISNDFALPDSNRIKEISLGQFPPDSDEPQIDVSSEEFEILPQRSREDRYSNGALQNDSGSDDIVLVYVFPNSDQKPQEEMQSETGGATKISVENSRLQPSDCLLEDDNSTDDVALVYTEPISDEPEQVTCSQCKTEKESSISTAKFDDQSDTGTADHDSNSKNNATADGVSQTNSRKQGHDFANGGENLPGYQPLNQQKREVEEKSRYQKLIKRKVA